MNEFINVSHVFVNDISRYITTSCDLKKRTRFFYVLMFFYLSIVLDSPYILKKKTALKG